MKLLLVEDDKVTRDYVISGLRGAGHVVDDIADGVDGLALALRGAGAIGAELPSRDLQMDAARGLGDQGVLP